MSRRRGRRAPALTSPVPGPATKPWSLPPRTLDLAVGAVVLLLAALAWASRGSLNVDGAAYLDLAHRLQSADWAGFVQGYWSPVYPVMLAAVLEVTGASGSAAVFAAHGLNFGIALCSVALIWVAARRRGAPAWGVVLLTAFLVSSARTARIDAVTPDLLLLATLIGFGFELLRPDGWRGLRLGAWAGAAFLVKTSVWPWLLATGLLGYLATRKRPERRAGLWRAAGVAAIPLVLWTSAMSIDAGKPTLGTTGELGACWYLWACDGRSPDSHRGGHVDYHDWLIGAGSTARVATFPGTPWTYAPWSDPSAWQEGITSQRRVRPTIGQLVVYAGKQFGLVIGVWMALLIVLVLLPTLFTSREASTLRTAFLAPHGFAMTLGTLGILQFVAVHAEPRLIAPFVMLFAMGWVTWRMSGVPTRAQSATILVGLLVALGTGTWHLRDQARVTASAAARTDQFELVHPPFAAPHRIAVAGPALPMMPDLYRAQAVVVAQVLAPDPASLLAWPPAAQTAMVARLREAGATALWVSRGRNAFRIVPLPAVAEPR